MHYNLYHVALFNMNVVHMCRFLTDCGIYLLKSMEIFIDAIVESITLGQSPEYTISFCIFYKFINCLKKF